MLKQNFSESICLIVALSIALGCNLAYGEYQPEIGIIFSRNKTDFTQKLIHILPHQNISANRIILLNSDENDFQAKLAICRSHCKVLIAVGYDGLEQAFTHRLQIPTVACLIYRYLYEQLIRDYAPVYHDHTALFIEQSIPKMMDLTAVLLNETRQARRVGVLISAYSKKFLPLLYEEAAAHNLDLIIQTVDAQTSPIQALQHLLPKCQMLMTLADLKIYNPQTVQGLLLAAFHHQVPVIGFSKVYVNVGALAAVYNNKIQHATEVAHLVSRYMAKEHCMLPQPHYPQKYKVVVNHRAAHILKLKLRHAKYIEHAMASSYKGVA